MARGKPDPKREHRIAMEIMVDAYDESERAMGWYVYLEDKLTFPFMAKCIANRAISPLRVGDEIEILGMAPDTECEHEMFVVTRWDRRDGLAVPLSQLEVICGDAKTREAVADWHYWVKRGYRF